MKPIIRELVVPCIVLLGTALYWLSIQGAPSSAQRVPNGVIIFVLVVAALVIGRAFAAARAAPVPEQPADGGNVLKEWAKRWWRQLAFVTLALGYYLSFSTLGFNLANLAFLLLAFPLAGLDWLKSAVAAILASMVFHAIAISMNLNVPVGPLGF